MSESEAYGFLCFLREGSCSPFDAEPAEVEEGGVQKLERIDDDLQVVSSWSVLQVSAHVS